MPTREKSGEGRKEKGKSSQTAEAIGQRVREAHSVRGLRRQAERVRADGQGVQAHVEEVAGTGAATRQPRRALVRTTRKVQARELRLLERDDQAVRAVLERKGPIEGLMAIDGSTA